jgi:hypothetical protein
VILERESLKRSGTCKKKKVIEKTVEDGKVSVEEVSCDDKCRNVNVN